MNRSHLAQAIIWLDQVKERAEAEAAKLRAQLIADARADYAEQGTAPTWRIPDVATISASVSKPSVTVSDEAEFLAWVRLRYPEHVRTVEQVGEPWRSRFLESLSVDGDMASHPDTGEVLSWARVRPGGQLYGVSIRATAQAKEIFGLTAAEGLKHAAALAGPNVPVVLAELEAS